jgi:hypothetical protein
VHDSVEPAPDETNPERNPDPNHVPDLFRSHEADDGAVGARVGDTSQAASRGVTQDSSWLEVDALALLHRTGVVQVMLRVPLPENLTGLDLVGKVTSKSAIITSSVLPEPLLEPTQLEARGAELQGRWQSETEEGVRWREIEFGEPTRLDDLFALYFAAFRASMPSLGPNWWCYPVLIADGVGCDCSCKEWPERHRTDLAKAMLHLDDPDHFRPALIADVLHDVSSVNDSSLFLTEFRGALIRSGRNPTSNWVDDLYTLIPIEQALLQRGQLWSLEWQFSQAAAKPRNLEKLERSVISGLDEFRSSQIHAGDSQALVDRMLDKMRVVSLYSRLMDSVNQLHQKVTAADANRAAVRANVLAFLALLFAIALGLPALRQSIQIAKTVPDDSMLAPTARPLVWLGDQGASGVWGAFLVMVAVAGAVWVAGVVRGRNKALRRRRRPAGRAWDVPLELTFTDRADDESPAS